MSWFFTGFSAGIAITLFLAVWADGTPKTPAEHEIEELERMLRR